MLQVRFYLVYIVSAKDTTRSALRFQLMLYVSKFVHVADVSSVAVWQHRSVIRGVIQNC